MRGAWIAVCALAVIGAFFVGLQLRWLGHVEPEWLPYPVHVVGAALAGLAMANAAPGRSWREPVAGGALAIVALAVISFALPKAFVLTAARIDQRWMVLPVILAASALACAGGAWLAGGKAAPRSVWIAVVAALTIGFATQHTRQSPRLRAGHAEHDGGRVDRDRGVGVSRRVRDPGRDRGRSHRRDRRRSGGVRGARSVELITRVSQHAPFEASAVLLAVPIVTAAIGARVIWRERARSEA